MFKKICSILESIEDVFITDTSRYLMSTQSDKQKLLSWMCSQLEELSKLISEIDFGSDVTHRIRDLESLASIHGALHHVRLILTISEDLPPHESSMYSALLTQVFSRFTFIRELYRHEDMSEPMPSALKQQYVN